jgi:hypothetical protein
MEIIRLSKPTLDVTEFENEYELVKKFREDTGYSETTAVKHLFSIFTGETKYEQNLKYAYCLRSNIN